MKIVDLAEIIAKFANYFRVDRLEESGALYAEIYAEDAELQELARLGLEEWPIETSESFDDMS
jgi:hypothetical protein